MGVWKPGNRLRFRTGNPDVYKNGSVFSAVCTGSSHDIYREVWKLVSTKKLKTINIITLFILQF